MLLLIFADSYLLVIGNNSAIVMIAITFDHIEQMITLTGV